MRVLLVPIAVLAFASPALAREPERAPAFAAEMLNDPAVQQGVADSVSDAVAALLDVRVGALERAANPFSNARRSETLRDRLDRDDPGFEARIHRDTRHATRAAGVMAGEFAAMIPELRARLARAKQRLRDDDGYGSAPPPPSGKDESFGDWDD